MSICSYFMGEKKNIKAVQLALPKTIDLKPRCIECLHLKPVKKTYVLGHCESSTSLSFNGFGNEVFVFNLIAVLLQS